MDTLVLALPVLAAAAVISFGVNVIARRYAARLGLLDIPEARKVHATPIPSIGGLGMVAGTMLPLLFVVPADRLVAAYAWGAFTLFALGIIDDRRRMGHYSKLLGQIVAVAPAVFYSGLFVERVPFLWPEPLPLDIAGPFTVFAIVGMINAVNHSDGLDGLAGGQVLLSLFALGALAVLAVDGGGASAATAQSLLLLVVAACGGAVLGFLPMNLFPARIFMGDSGSQFLGFTLGFLAVLLTQRVDVTLSPALPLLILGLPIADILAVLYLRASSGMHWFYGTDNHLHHRLLNLGFGHRDTVRILWSVQTFLIGAALVMAPGTDGPVFTLYLVVCAFAFALVTLAERRGWRFRTG